MNFKAAPSQRLGNLLLGLGVQVDSIVQKTDKFLDSRLRDAVSEQSSAEVEEQTYTQLEALFGELSDTDLSSSLNNFFNTISEILNQPRVMQRETLPCSKVGRCPMISIVSRFA